MAYKWLNKGEEISLNSNPKLMSDLSNKRQQIRDEVKRLSRKMSKAQLAAELDIHYRTLDHILKDEKVHIKTYDHAYRNIKRLEREGKYVD